MIATLPHVNCITWFSRNSNNWKTASTAEVHPDVSRPSATEPIAINRRRYSKRNLSLINITPYSFYRVPLLLWQFVCLSIRHTRVLRRQTW